MPRRRVTFQGLTAVYSPAELKFVQLLWRRSKREALFVHEAMARFDGRLR